jgi:hypothetical protein
MKKPRGAPPVAAVNASQALKNLEVKRDLVRRWLLQQSASSLVTDTTGELRLIEIVPDSVRRFNKWNSQLLEKKSADAPLFGPNSNETLKRHTILYEDVKKLIEGVRLSRRVVRGGGREESIALLTRRVMLAEQIRRIAERELAIARDAMLDAKEEAKRLGETLDSALGAAREELELLGARVVALERENAQLVAALRKTTGLRRA